jgi:uncharacterized protein (TIGR00299 family) protein
MKAILFDLFSGAAGDMILASLFDLGADQENIIRTVESAADVFVKATPVSRNGIRALKVHVQVRNETHPRSFFELMEKIANLPLPERVKRDVAGVFEILAEAESAAHGEPLDRLHFHEVGQDDAIADVIGSCMAFADLAPDSVLCTPINVGGGQIQSVHGTFPVPAPATLRILERFALPFYGNGARELLTPTGAALLAHFARPVAGFPLGTCLSTGYGAGDAETEQPNVLRAALMELAAGLREDRIDILETNLDDVSGEILGNLFERLSKMGAKDVSISPLTMKKGRPGHLLRVLATPEQSQPLALEIMRQTGTLGIRVLHSVQRFIAQRSFRNVSLRLGEEEARIGIKVAFDPEGWVLNLSAEYEDCRNLAEKTGLPLREVLRRAEEQAWKTFDGN